MNELNLKSQHIIVYQPWVEKLFLGEAHVLLKYDTTEKVLLMAPASKSEFKLAHKAAQHMLKDRNLKGDKSIAIHEILIDHELDQNDRVLACSEEEGIVKISL
jgi:hypothetical protein